MSCHTLLASTKVSPGAARGRPFVRPRNSGCVPKLRLCRMVLGAYASLNPGSRNQVQEDHTVLRVRMKVGPVDGKVMLDCTFRPLLLRGEAAGQV